MAFPSPAAPLVLLNGRIAQDMAIGRGFVADAGKAQKTFRIFTSVCPVQQ
jgi:hypothetical protein